MRWTDYIQLPRLDIEGQEWTVERQIFKMMEELGEVSQAFYKENGLDKMAAEALDFVQTGVTLLYMLEAQGVDVDSIFDAFMSKLGQRGYLKVV
jgi:NTP pyrophosphatase (non-canonical NTP hydrolase)